MSFPVRVLFTKKQGACPLPGVILDRIFDFAVAVRYRKIISIQLEMFSAIPADDGISFI